MCNLLAIDLGIKTGFALYNKKDKLCWYRSNNLGSRKRLKRRALSMLNEINNIDHILMEGGGDLANIWLRVAKKKEIPCRLINAENWRETLFVKREWRDGKTAKKSADILARKIIKWSETERPTSLTHDAAEAILIGFWGAIELGWIDRVPTF